MDVCTIVIGIREIWSECNSLVKVAIRPVEITLGNSDESAIVIAVCKARADPQLSIVVFDRLFIVTECSACQGAIMKGVGRIGSQFEAPVEIADRLVEPPECR